MSRAILNEEDGSIAVGWNLDGDHIVSVDVTSFGFSGHADGHVDSKCFQNFRRDLADLEERRNGAAILTSITPGLFEIRIRSVDKLGHMAVEGKLRFDGTRNRFHRQLLEFEFEFDPSKLRSFVSAFDT